MDPKAREYRSIIYNAANSGNLNRIKIFTEKVKRDKAWIDECFNHKESDHYPLVIAARNGHTEIVEYLLNIGADPSVRGVVEFDNDNIQGTPPLWAASAAGHIEIVKLLVEKANADVDQATNTRSTPLRGACYDGHLDIVRYLLTHGANPHIPNRHGHTCLMIAAYRNKIEIVEELLKAGIDVNIQTERGNSALHDAAESGNVEVVNMLLAHGAVMLKDVQGVDPLLGSALSGYIDVLEILAKQMPSAVHRRDALKLLGSTLLDKKMDSSQAMICWRRAMNVPLTHDEQRLIRELETFFEPQEVYDNQREAHSLAQVEQLDGNIEAQRMQALVIRERILGGQHTDVHYYLRFRGAVYCDMGQMNKCYELWKHALFLQQKHFAPLYYGTITTIVAFQDTFSLSLNDYVNNHHMNRNLRVKSSWVQYLFGKVCEELERAADWTGGPLLEDTECCGKDKCAHATEETEHKKLVVVAGNLINILERLSLPSVQIENSDEEKEPKADIARLLAVCKRLKIPILHYILEEPPPDQHVGELGLPKAAVLEQILEFDLDVNVADKNGDLPMHLVLRSPDYRASLVRALFSRGTWLFARNHRGEVILDMLKQCKRTKALKYEDIELGHHISLLGLASNALRVKYAENFDGAEEGMPLELYRFYMTH